MSFILVSTVVALLYCGCLISAIRLRVPRFAKVDFHLRRAMPVQSSVAAVGINLAHLLHHAQVGARLNKSIVAWLDFEYIPQQIHLKLGEKVSSFYQQYRARGVDDLVDVLIQLGSDLEKVDMEDAFVNAWDIANKASELIMAELISHHEYSASLSAALHNRVAMKDTEDDYSSTFARYTLLQRFVEGEILYKDVHSIVALLLGFRLQLQAPATMADTQAEGGGEWALRQDPLLAPLRWANLTSVPVLGSVGDTALQERLAADLPEDDSSTDTVLETLVGADYYGRLKNSTDPHVLRRIVVAKWIYVQGFLGADFPPRERYVPPHMAEEAEDNSAFD